MALAPTEAGNGLRERIARSTDSEQSHILDVFARVPRHAFLPPALTSRSYEDTALPIGLGQTISQPTMIALMFLALDVSPRQRVLEVGSGSGYALALLSEVGCEVFGVERHADLVARSRETLRSIGLSDVTIKEGDGTLGWAEHAPYDRILVSAAASQIPSALLTQLAEGGRLVMPVGGAEMQTLVTCERDDKGTLHYRAGSSCVFVPLITDTPG